LDATLGDGLELDDIPSLTDARIRLIEEKGGIKQQSVIRLEGCTLQHVVDILRSVHTERPNYHMVTANCVWFAVDVLSRKAGGGFMKPEGESAFAELQKVGLVRISTQDSHQRIVNR
jgi:hypothetical protein